MIQKIFLGIMSLSLIVFLFLFFPVYQNNVNELVTKELQEKRAEIQEIKNEKRAEIQEIKNEKRDLETFLNTVGIVATEEYTLEEFSVILKDLRNYVYNNFEDRAKETNIDYLYNFQVNSHLDDYEERLNTMITSAYIRGINDIVRSIAEDFSQENEYRINEILRLATVDLHLKFFSPLYLGTSITRDKEYIMSYVDVEASRRKYNEEITDGEIKNNMIENYLRYLEDNKI